MPDRRVGRESCSITIESHRDASSNYDALRTDGAAGLSVTPRDLPEVFYDGEFGVSLSALG